MRITTQRLEIVPFTLAMAQRVHQLSLDEDMRAFLPVMMARMQLKQVRGVCLAENAASIRVLEKCGFRLIARGMGAYQGKWREICTYEYTLA